MNKFTATKINNKLPLCPSMRYNILHRGVLYILLLLSPPISGAPPCSYENEKKICHDFQQMSNTSDDLYWNDTKYLMDHSPLDTFVGYRDIFATLAVDIVTPVQGGFSPVFPEKNYALGWKLVDGKLYLNHVWFQDTRRTGTKKNETVPMTDSRFLWDEQYKIVSEFTGEEFRKYPYSLYLASNRYPQSLYGVIPAVWVNGDFYVKKKRQLPESYTQWIRSPFYKLTFCQGKLIAVQEIENIPATLK